MAGSNKSLGRNVILNAIRSGLSVIFPLITYPYAFRILHADGIGRVNYAQSIISYFSLLAGLGISTYAVREGAKLRDDKDKLKRFCDQIVTINLITSFVAYVLLFVCMTAVHALEQYRDLLLLLSLTIGFTTLGVEWLNTIYEDFLYTTVRSIAIYIVTLVLLFVMVRDQNDVIPYALLTVTNSGLICISNWFYCRRFVRIGLTRETCFRQHIKPILTIFATLLTTTIYMNSDTTMLGIFVGDYYVGLYSLAVKIYNVVKTMLAGVYSTAIPRVAFHIGQKDSENLKRVFTLISVALTIVVLPAGVGLAAVSQEIVYVMGGTEYTDSVLTLQILSLALIGAVFGGLFSYCLNIPLGRENINVQATTLSALSNVGLNIILIPLFKQNGAAATTAIAEFFVLIYCVYKCHDLEEYLDLQDFRRNLYQSLIGCVTIVLVTVAIKIMIQNLILRLIIIVLFSVLFYSLELIIMKNELMMHTINKLRKPA